MMRWQTNLNKASVITKCTMKCLHLLVAKKSTVCIYWPTDFTKQHISLIFFFFPGLTCYWENWTSCLIWKVNFLVKRNLASPVAYPNPLSTRQPSLQNANLIVSYLPALKFFNVFLLIYHIIYHPNRAILRLKEGD